MGRQTRIPKIRIVGSEVACFSNKQSLVLHSCIGSSGLTTRGAVKG